MWQNDERRWAEETFQKVLEKYRRSAKLATEDDIIPYRGENGRWGGPPFDGDGWWTNGFWPALMWQLYAATGEAQFLQEARRVQERLLKEMRAFVHLNHDVGFVYLLSVGADAKLTGAEQARVDTLHAANILAGRFNPVGFIRAWNGADRNGWAIVDCMMNLTLLYWAQQETGDPRFANIAKTHADTCIKHFVRQDGSCNHIVIFDPETGEALDAPGGQGYAKGSSWSRGQSWALYGFTLSYMATGEARYLETAEKVAAYFMAHIRPDGLTDCDFVQPPQPECIDNIAGAVAASAYIELARLTGKPEYQKAALRLLHGIDDHTADWSEASPGILQNCTASYHDDGAGRHIHLNYGDYFFIEALAKLTGTDPMLWMHEKPEQMRVHPVEIALLDGAGNELAQAHGTSEAYLLTQGAYPEGARLAFRAGKGFLWVQVDSALAPALVYLPDGGMEYRIPRGEEALAHPPQAFSGEKKLVRAWLPREEELYHRRNLAQNTADQRGEVTAYPHATANVETREEAVFAARNVIDGYVCNDFHGEWPYQSWGIGAREDAWCKLEFGRPVYVDGMTLTLRADFPHDAYWTGGTVECSDGAEIPFTLRRTGEAQAVDIGAHTVTWMRLTKLIKSDDPSAFPALTEWEVFGTEA